MMIQWNPLKKYLKAEKSEHRLDPILYFFDKFKEKKNSQLPLEKLKDILKEKKANNEYDIIKALEKVYINYFSSKIRKMPFKPCWSDFNDVIVQQNKISKYEKLIETYEKKIKKGKLPNKFRSDLIEIIKLESESEKLSTFLNERYDSEFPEGEHFNNFSNFCNVSEKEIEYLDLMIEKYNSGCEKKKKSVEKEKSYEKKNSSYDDDDNYNEYDYYETYNSKSNRSSNNNNYNKNKKIKLIMCQNCLHLNKCPMCHTKMNKSINKGNKMNKSIHVGYILAHSNCYKEGTCFFCNKKQRSQNITSVCYKCERSYTSYKCFICKKNF